MLTHTLTALIAIVITFVATVSLTINAIKIYITKSTLDQIHTYIEKVNGQLSMLTITKTKDIALLTDGRVLELIKRKDKPGYIKVILLEVDDNQLDLNYN